MLEFNINEHKTTEEQQTTEDSEESQIEEHIEGEGLVFSLSLHTN